MSAHPRLVFITGASSGLGAALARHYAAQGATLGLVARRASELSQLADSLHHAHGTRCLIYPLDVTDAPALSTAAHDFMQHAGVPDVVIANAGVSVGTLTDYAEDTHAFRRVMDINVMGVVHTFQPFMAPMRARRAGTLAGIASVAGIRGLPGAGAYSASKAAVISYLESLRVELHGSGVRVSTVLPGYVATPMTAINPYPMPFLLPADVAARRIARAINRGAGRAVVPWQMAVAAYCLARLPNWLFDRLFARAGRKPRGLPL